MYAERERKSNFITIFFLLEHPEADDFLAGCGGFHAPAAATALAWLAPPSSAFHQRLLRAIPTTTTTTTTLPTIAREGSQILKFGDFN
jgi:hypothetical protein